MSGDHNDLQGHNVHGDGDHSHRRSSCDHDDRTPSGKDDHERGTGVLHRLKELVSPHSHDAADSIDTALETSRKGMRVLKMSFAALMVTALAQVLVVVVSGSVALLSDTIHNFSDALTAIPIALAFTVGRRVATRRYTYGYGRAEDVAGIVVVVLIAASAALAGYESFRRLLDPHEIDALGLVAAAGFIGFVGNEFVARYRINVGREIGSAALVADGLHARTDGFTSLAVVFGALGAWLGFPLADPIIGLLITVAILTVLRDAAREVYRRLMDAVDPDLVDRVTAVLHTTPKLKQVGQVRLRWIGHQLRAECEILVDDHWSIVEAHRIAEDAQHRLIHDVPRLTTALVHVDPLSADGADHHELSRHHDSAVARVAR